MGAAIRFNENDLAVLQRELMQRRLDRPALRQYLFVYFKQVRRQAPQSLCLPIENDDDLIVFIFFDENEARSEATRQMDDFIRRLATIYFYTNHQPTLDQLTLLLLNRLWVN